MGRERERERDGERERERMKERRERETFNIPQKPHFGMCYDIIMKTTAQTHTQ